MGFSLSGSSGIENLSLAFARTGFSILLVQCEPDTI